VGGRGDTDTVRACSLLACSCSLRACSLLASRVQVDMHMCDNRVELLDLRLYFYLGTENLPAPARTEAFNTFVKYRPTCV
jgi:hypothetical protein